MSQEIGWDWVLFYFAGLTENVTLFINIKRKNIEQKGRNKIGEANNLFQEKETRPKRALDAEGKPYFKYLKYFKCLEYINYLEYFIH